MSPTRGALSAADTAERLGVSKSRVSQLLNEQCAFVDPPIFELESPEGRPTGTAHVSDRTVTLASIEAYEERHPWSASGRRRTRHPPAPTRDRSMPPRSGGSASIQVLRLELEHQLERNRELADQLEAQQRAAVEHARALRHQIVDLEADLDLRNTSAEALATKLAGLQSAFDAYGDVLTQEVGPQDTSGA